MTENKIKKITNFLMDQAGKAGKVFDVYGVDTKNETIMIEVHIPVEGQLSKNVLLETNTTQENMTTVNLKQAIATL